MWQLHFPQNKGKQEQAVYPFHTLKNHYWNLSAFFSFPDNLLQDSYIVGHRNVGDLEIAHKTCSIFKSV